MFRLCNMPFVSALLMLRITVRIFENSQLLVRFPIRNSIQQMLKQQQQQEEMRRVYLVFYNSVIPVALLCIYKLDTIVSRYISN